MRYSKRLLTSAIALKLARRLKRAGVPFAHASLEQFRTVSLSERMSGVGVVLRQNAQALAHIAPGDDSCWVGLSQVRAPGKLGIERVVEGVMNPEDAVRMLRAGAYSTLLGPIREDDMHRASQPDHSSGRGQ